MWPRPFTANSKRALSPDQVAWLPLKGAAEWSEAKHLNGSENNITAATPRPYHHHSVITATREKPVFCRIEFGVELVHSDVQCSIQR